MIEMILALALLATSQQENTANSFPPTVGEPLYILRANDNPDSPRPLLYDAEGKSLPGDAALADLTFPIRVEEVRVIPRMGVIYGFDYNGRRVFALSRQIVLLPDFRPALIESSSWGRGDPCWDRDGGAAPSQAARREREQQCSAMLGALLNLSISIMSPSSRPQREAEEASQREAEEASGAGLIPICPSDRRC